MGSKYLVLAIIFIWGTYADPHKRLRKDASEIPAGVRAGGSCRLLINEINTYPKWEETQFIELMIYCKPNFKTRETAFKMSTFRLAIISHDGKLLGVCHLKGNAVYSRTTYGLFMAYTIGQQNIPNSNMQLDDCELPTETYFNQKRKNLPVGSEHPIGLALLYNERENVLRDVSLTSSPEGFQWKSITYDIETTLMRNLQDLIVYGSSTPFSRCKYFETFYSGYNLEADYLAREWHGFNSSTNRGLSRCGFSNDADDHSSWWLPFQPQLFASAPVSPGQINVCEQSVRYVVDEELPAKKRPRFDNLTPSRYTCVITRESEEIDLAGEIISADDYLTGLTNKLEEAERCRKLSPTPIPEPIIMDINLHPDIEAEFGNDLGYNTNTSEAAETSASMDDATLFENILANGTPYIWDDCDHDSSYIESATKSSTGNSAWLYARDVLDKLVCYWLEILENLGQVRCRICHKLWKEKIIFDRPGSDYITKLVTTGQGTNDPKGKTKSRNSVHIRNHLKNPLHLISREYFKLYDQGKRGKELRDEFEKKGGVFRNFLWASENVIATVFQAVRLGITFFNYKILVETIKYNGGVLGHLYANPQGMKTLLMSISDTFHDDYISYLKSKSPKLSIVIDSSSDLASVPSIAIIFTTYDNSEALQVRLYKVLEIKGNESAENLFRTFKESLQKDGIEEYVSENCVGFTSDGGSNVIKFRKLLNEFTLHEIITNHCAAHRLELVTQHAWDGFEFLNLIDKTVNRLYRLFNSRSPKKKQLLKLSILELGDSSFELKKIRRIRWISHKLRATRVILDHWITIENALEKATKDKSINLESKNEAQEIRELISDRTFLITLAFVIDVAEKLSELSRNVQYRGASLITRRERRDLLLLGLFNLNITNGPAVLNLLANSSGSQSDALLSIESFENQATLFKGKQLNPPNELFGDHRLYLQRHRYIESLMEQIEIYFPHDAADTFQIFNQKHWKLDTIESYGANRLVEANTKLRWNYNNATLVNAWRNIKLAVISSDTFESRKNLTAEEFWALYLQDERIPWTEDIKTIISSVITVPVCSAEAERVYSLYTATKTSRRWSLNVNTIDAIIRIKFNGPKKLEELDTLNLVKGFLAKHSRSDDSSRAAVKKLTSADHEVLREFDNELNDPVNTGDD